MRKYVLLLAGVCLLNTSIATAAAPAAAGQAPRRRQPAANPRQRRQEGSQGL